MLRPPRVRHVPITWHARRVQPVQGALVHSMAAAITADGQTYDAPAWLQHTGVSVHAMIQPDGTLLRCVDETEEAFHAGQSVFAPTGEAWLNRSFLGCEFLVAGVRNWTEFVAAIAEPTAYTAAQYETGGFLYASWMARYAIPRDHIVGHSDVSGPTVRSDPKPDPGAGFAWEAFWAAVDRWLDAHRAHCAETTP